MFKKIKENWQKRIEKNAFVSTLSFIDRDKTTKTERVYFKRSLIPLGDWGRIYPPIKENGNRIHWTNLIFGGWRNFVKLLIICIIIGLVLLQFYENFQVIETLRNSCPTININP